MNWENNISGNSFISPSCQEHNRKTLFNAWKIVSDWVVWVFGFFESVTFLLVCLYLTSPGVSGGGALRNISAQGENQLKRLRRSVHKPYEPCFRHFFVYNQPPTGFRVNLNEIRYICQQIGGSHDVFYATMFDEHHGIAVYAGYILDRQTINFGQAHGRRGWSREPGKGEGT